MPKSLVTSTTTVRWGILGLGKIAHKFAQDLATVPNTSLYAVASRSASKAKEFAETYEVACQYASYEALLQNTEVDAIYIATPHVFHKAHTLRSLAYKKAVLCEKPFAMSSDEVAEMIAASKSQNCLLMEGLWTYFLPHYQFVLDQLQQGTIGNITRLEADFGFYTPFDENSRVFNKALGGGSLLDIGIYPIFAALTTLGLPQTLSAKANFFENGADAYCNMQFHYPNTVAILKSTLTAQTPTQAIFYGDTVTLMLHTRWHEPSWVSITKDGRTEEFHFDVSTHGYSYEISHFNALLRAGKIESDIMTFAFSKQLMKTLDAVRGLIKLDYK